MEKYITDERTGLNYELVGNYYLITGDDEPEQKTSGIWGQRHCNYLREHKHAIYSGLLISGKLDGYLREIDQQAEMMFSQLVKQIVVQEIIFRQAFTRMSCSVSEAFILLPLQTAWTAMTRPPANLLRSSIS